MAIEGIGSTLEFEVWTILAVSNVFHNATRYLINCGLLAGIN